MTLTPNTAIVPTRESELYPTMGVDLIVAETEDREWQHVEWIESDEPWDEVLWRAGYKAFDGDAEHVTEDYLQVKIERIEQ